jgi:Leucine-rich repeat (LRR) protein
MFTSMTTLEVLDISSNKLNDFKGNAFTNNKYMWYLDASNNKLHTLSVSSFKGLENSIREMDLSWNNLSILEKNIFSNLHDLQILRLKSKSARIVSIPFKGNAITFFFYF